MMRWLLVILTLSMILANPTLAQTSDSDENPRGLITSWPVIARGDLQTRSDDYAMRYDPTDSFQTFRLQAERIELEMKWKRGVAIADGSLVTITPDSGTERMNLDEAELSVSPFQGEPLIFATTTGQEESAFSLNTSARTTWTSTEDVVVVAEGTTPYAQATDEDMELGFWYTAEGPLIEARTPGVLQLEGTFSLFLHNLQIDAEGDDGTKWSDWTGYREEDSGPGTKQYEYRITTVQVENGTLLAAPKKPVAHYASHLEVHVDGSVAAQEVTGELVRSKQTFRFHQEPLRLEGTGTLDLQAERPAEGPRLALRASEGLRIDQETDRGPPAGPPLPPKLLTPLLAILLVTATTAGLSRTQPGRRLRKKAWSTRGEHAAQAGHWDRSSRCYRHAIRAIPEDASIWHELIQVELQARRGHRAELYASQAAGIPGMDPWDLLAQRAAAAWLRDDHTALHIHLQKLHEGAPEMAQALTRSLQLEPHHPPEDPIDGYA